MNNTSEQLIAHAISKGWDKTLVNSLIELAGGFDAVFEHTAVADELIFVNSMSGRLDLDEDEPSAICSSEVLAEVAFLNKSNADVLSKFFKAHHEAIKASLIRYGENTNTDAKIEFAHLTHRLSDEDDLEVWGSGTLDSDGMRYVVITVYYQLLTLMVDLQGGFDAKRLSELDLSKVTGFQCMDSQVVFECKSSVKQVGFIDDHQSLEKIYDRFYVELSLRGKGKQRHIAHVLIRPKDKNFKRFPIRYACKKIKSLIVGGESFVEADIVNKTKNDIYISGFDRSMIDMVISTPKSIELDIADNTIMVAAGECDKTCITLNENAQLFSTKLKTKNRDSIRCAGDNVAFINSEAVNWEKKRHSDENTVVNNGVIPFDPDYILFLKALYRQDKDWNEKSK